MFKYIAAASIVLSIMVFVPNDAKAQEVLTNANIIELVKAGLSEDIILTKIQQSVCKCDISTRGLLELQAARVPDSIIRLMVQQGGKSTSGTVASAPASGAAEAPGQRVAAPQPGKGSVSDSMLDAPKSKLPADDGVSAAISQISSPGIFLYEDGNIREIDPTSFSGTKMNPLVSGLTGGLKKTDYLAKVQRSTSNTPVKGSRPIFYFVFNPEIKVTGAVMSGFWGMPATSPAEFTMVRMTGKKGTRQVALGTFSAWTGVETGPKDKDVRQFSFEKVRDGLYRVVTGEDLTAGEYCFFYAGNVAGLGVAGGKIFDFTVK